MGGREILGLEGTIQPWGNSLGIRITRPISELSGLKRGDRVLLEVVDEGLLVRRKVEDEKPGRLPFTEADLVDGLTSYTAHADRLPIPLPSERGE